MRPTLRLPLLALAVAQPVMPIAAQHSPPGPIGFFGGVSFERGHPRNGLGLQVGGLLRVGLTARLGVQFDLAYQSFTGTGGNTYSTRCLAPSAGEPACGTVRTIRLPITVASATANFRYAERRAAGGAFYGLAGIGMYAVEAQSPGDGSYTRAGWNVGGGFRLRRSLFLDVRYHRLIRPKTTRSLVPVTLIVRF